MSHGRPWGRIIAVMCAIALLLVMLTAFASAQEPSCAAWQPPAGAIIATRNISEPDNSFPYPQPNHLATVVGPGTDGRIYLVEAQRGVYGNGVQYVSLDDFLRRPYHQPIVYVYRDPAVGARAAAIAQSQVGQPYGRLASFGPQRIRALVPAILGRPPRQSCVSAVRQQAEGATGLALWGFNTPADIGTRPDVFAGPYLLSQVPSVPGGAR